MNKIFVVYMVIPPEDNETESEAPDFDFAGCIDSESDGLVNSWSFLTEEEANEARKLAWDYCKHKDLLGFVDMGVKYSNGEENTEATVDMQEELENSLSEVLSDLAMEKATGCIDIALTSLLKAAILDLEAPPEIFFATVEGLYASIMDEDDEEGGDNEPPKVFH